MEITTVVILTLLAGLLVIAVWYALRWLRIRRLGSVSVALRWRPDNSRQGWHLGIGRYRGEEFVWYRVWSLRNGPDRIFSRANLEITGRRDSIGSESYAVPAGATVLQCDSVRHGPIEIAMGPGALTGFLSWLESAPPGHRLPRAS